MQRKEGSMARIRTIKPEFFKNEQLADLPMTARLLFIGLWTLSDKEGRLDDRPKRIKAELFPYDNLDCDKELTRLQSSGFIYRYEVGEMKVIQVINFTTHQRITGKESESEPTVEELLREQKVEVLINLLHLVHRSHIASNYAFEWAVRLHDTHFEEIRIAALLHDISELLMWCFAPTDMLKLS